jgi:hypothetical protein
MSTTSVYAENILRVADAIETHSIPGLGFNMGAYIGPATEHAKDLSGHRCGTIACIAGWTYAVRNKVQSPEPVPTLDFDYDAEGVWLGLNDDLTHDLFHGYSNSRLVKPAQAVRTLRHLAATGEVSWEV